MTNEISVLHERRSWPPRWQVVVRVVGALTVIALALGAADMTSTGILRPWTAGLGILATVFVNRVYVVVSRRGHVIEGIDIAEAPIITLALLLPPGEAVLTFVVASVLMEFPFERALEKKVFNVGVRAVGAALLVTPLAVVGNEPTPGFAQIVAVTIGAVAYTVFTAVAIALVVSSVSAQTVRNVLRSGIGARMLVWAMATIIGISSAHVALRVPAALVGVMAVLVLVFVTAHAAERSQREADRLHHLLDASTRIQASDGIDEQEDVLVDVARELLLWKDVEVRERPPSDSERGRRLYTRDGAERWLVAVRLPGSDPWHAEDENVVDFLAQSARAAYERASMQAELSRQALLDPLTGVANRRHFDREVNRLLAAGGRAYAIVLCDLDHFKTVNDRLGHDAGDELLRIAAARLTASVRAGDLVARLGGDEFVVLLPGVSSRAALERVRDNIAARLEQPVKVGRWQLSSLPCSLGIAAAPRDGRTPREVLRVADESMYDTKRARKSGAARLTVTLPDAGFTTITSGSEAS